MNRQQLEKLGAELASPPQRRGFMDSLGPTLRNLFGGGTPAQAPAAAPAPATSMPRHLLKSLESDLGKAAPHVIGPDTVVGDYKPNFWSGDQVALRTGGNQFRFKTIPGVMQPIQAGVPAAISGLGGPLGQAGLAVSPVVDAIGQHIHNGLK